MPEYLTIQEAAKAIKYTVKTLYRWHNEGKIKFSKVGPRFRIERGELERFINAAAAPTREA